MSSKTRKAGWYLKNFQLHSNVFLLFLSSLPHYQAEYLIFRKWPIEGSSVAALVTCYCLVLQAASIVRKSKSSFHLTELTGQTGHLEGLTLQRIQGWYILLQKNAREDHASVELPSNCCIFLQTDGSGRPVLTKGKRFKSLFQFLTLLLLARVAQANHILYTALRELLHHPVKLSLTWSNAGDPGKLLWTSRLCSIDRQTDKYIQIGVDCLVRYLIQFSV